MGNAYLKVAGSSLLNYYRSADDVEKSIVSHSVTAGALALVPLPGYSEAACLLVQMGMYKSGEFHGQRSLAGYSPLGRKESDTTEATEHTDQQKHITGNVLRE